MRASVLAGCILVGAGSAVQAASSRYDCTFATGNVRDGNWVPKILLLQHDTSGGKVTVFDPVIRHFVGVPIQGKVGDETGRRIAFSWNLRAQVPNDARVAMNYDLVYYKESRRAKIRVQPQGYENVFSGEGTCKLAKG